VPAASHLKLLAMGVAVWAAFWVAGLPDYYQQYSFPVLAIGTAALVPPSAWIGWLAISRARPEHRLSKSLWLSFYFSAPFLALDALYCGWYLGHGTAFFGLFWYLTVFYVIPWIIWPPIGWWLSRVRAPATV
jgi:hypothetical protein